MKSDYPFDELVAKFDIIFSGLDTAMRAVFSDFPENNDIDSVFPKVAVINGLYGTHIKQDRLREMAKHIVEVNSRGNDDIGKRLEEFDLELVKAIAETPADMDNAWVFASKYCHFSNPKVYPLFDSRSRKSLCYVYNKEFPGDIINSDTSLVNYDTYRTKLRYLMNEWGESEYKRMDEFLWMYADLL